MLLCLLQRWLAIYGSARYHHPSQKFLYILNDIDLTEPILRIFHFLLRTFAMNVQAAELLSIPPQGSKREHQTVLAAPCLQFCRPEYPKLATRKSTYRADRACRNPFRE